MKFSAHTYAFVITLRVQSSWRLEIKVIFNSHMICCIFTVDLVWTKTLTLVEALPKILYLELLTFSKIVGVAFLQSDDLVMIGRPVFWIFGWELSRVSAFAWLLVLDIFYIFGLGIIFSVYYLWGWRWIWPVIRAIFLERWFGCKPQFEMKKLRRYNTFLLVPTS